VSYNKIENGAFNALIAIFETFTYTAKVWLAYVLIM